MRASCINNVKQVGLAFREWVQDHNDLYPMQVSVTGGGAMELAATGNVVAVFQVMSNELSNPRILCCPYDEKRSGATDFTSLAPANISYFVGLDAGTNHSGNRILCGDANLAVRGEPVKSGLLYLPSNAPVNWDDSRADQHSTYGNLGLADGSVQEVRRFGFTEWLVKTGLSTNRLAIP